MILEEKKQEHCKERRITKPAKREDTMNATSKSSRKNDKNCKERRRYSRKLQREKKTITEPAKREANSEQDKKNQPTAKREEHNNNIVKTKGNNERN